MLAVTGSSRVSAFQCRSRLLQRLSARFFLTSDDEVVVVEDTLLDARFATHPLVIGAPNIRFYAAVRLSVDGQSVGTLCVYDTTSRQVSGDQVTALKILGRAAVESLAQRLARLENSTPLPLTSI